MVWSEMDLTLSLGDPPAKPAEEIAGCGGERHGMSIKLGVCMGFGIELRKKRVAEEENRGGDKELGKMEERRWSVDSPLQLNLLPLAHISRLEETTQLNGNLEPPVIEEVEEQAAVSSSQIRGVCSLHVNFAGGVGVAAERGSSRGSDEEENDRGRKKLRLSKEQSAFLEESFKEQSTLNPKLKFVLAKQLNLRPRQIEVWFQNRRARTKLKQMEMDCEFLKRRCETLREENRRLHKEVAELRAIKSFHIQIPPTTLSICSSCERVSPPPTSPPQPPQTPR
ncbi:homeobox-leucine zipper protein HOX27-like [Phalaenopsis equestris]|uniref:homeobox-leucine zipper protein HOX27-like n=1 Tax=Phalaenopsis equestris TaxID=78828 RepID=UPI0009E5D345|nr:homeobox-leucine zipper protein HOX27-like [Phalaenopsis equestris]